MMGLALHRGGGAPTLVAARYGETHPLAFLGGPLDLSRTQGR